MGSHSLIWAAVPHNSDGVVFQIRIVHGLQRFHVPRRVLESVFALAPGASDAKQLQHFYLHATRILAEAGAKRSFSGPDTVPLQAPDFVATREELFASSRHAAA
jgi:hypothetical protein